MTTAFNIQEWHHCFREATGHDTTLDFYRESMWTEFLRYMMKVRPDFSMADLKAVIANRKRRERLREQGKWSVAFNAVVGSPDIIDDEIAEARAKARERKPTAKQEILRAIGRPEHKEQPAKAVGDVIAAAKAFDAFRAWNRDNL